MRLLYGSIVISSVIFLFCEILSQNLASSSHVQGLTTLAAVWNILPSAVLANSRRDGRGEPVKNQVIDDILRKAEVAKERQKKEQAQSKLTTPEDPATLDPVKCFPKALCGVSSEVEQISKRKKNGLITEYLILMKAAVRHPEFLEDLVSTPSKNKDKEKNKPQDDANASGSEEDDEYDDGSDEEDEESDDIVNDDEGNKDEGIKKKKKKETPPKNDDDFQKAYIKEKVEMDKLIKDTMTKEEKEMNQFWWDENDSGSQRPQRRPAAQPWNRPNRPQQQSPNRPWGFGGGGGYNNNRPSRPFSRPFSRPYFRGDEDTTMDEGGASSIVSKPIAGISSFFTNLFGLGDSSLTNDPWFQSAARDLSTEVAPGIAVDETREILETALDIGNSFDKPSQCNEIFNACQYDYTELLYMIDDLRKNVRAKVKEEESGSKKKKVNKKKENAKSELLATKNTKSKTRRRKKPVSSSISDEVDERYEVIPVTPPEPQSSSPFTDTFPFSNVLSWLGLGGSGSY